ncbi:MAG: glycosyltransferase family 4 protein [Planctomycetes bacterium]|nr:glycosyltransferase family 4 protein [Planctomycetota bacterium]
MRILYHHRTASRDGQEVHISELVAALRALGHEVTVAAPGGGEPAGAMGGHRAGLARLRALLPDALLPLAACAYDALFARRLAARGRGIRAEVLYERHALRNRAGLRAARRLAIPLLLEVNAPLAREEAACGRGARLERALQEEVATIGAADAVLAVTGVLRDILIADGVPAERIHVVPNGVAEEWLFAPRDLQAKGRLGVAEKLVLGFVGFPRPWHGLEQVVEALGQAQSGPLAQAVLLIGGEGPALPGIRALAERLGVAERVRFHGVLDRRAVPAFIDAFDVALQPRATAYASPLKLFEYLARGVAVVAPRQQNIEEVLEDGRSALLFAPDDPQGLRAALLRLAADPELRRALGEGGRRRIVEGGFTWQAGAERVAGIARRLLDERRARGGGR